MRKSAAVLLLMTFSLMFASRANAQNYPPGMDRLLFLVGDWAGEGWIEAGEGMRQSFTMKLSGKYKAGGGMVAIEGLGTEGFPGRPERFVIHRVFFVVGFDWKEKIYRFHSFLFLEGLVDTIPTVGPNVFIWGYQEDFMRRHVRYTIRVSEKKQWFEIGELSSDNGKSWRKFFEMNLAPVKVAESKKEGG